VPATRDPNENPHSHATAHQCGTVPIRQRSSHVGARSLCRTFDHRNLFVIDASSSRHPRGQSQRLRFAASRADLSGEGFGVRFVDAAVTEEATGGTTESRPLSRATERMKRVALQKKIAYFRLRHRWRARRMPACNRLSEDSSRQCCWLNRKQGPVHLDPRPCRYLYCIGNPGPIGSID